MSHAETKPVAETGPRHCRNCGAELLGEHCYRCGQPVEGLVRHFGSIVGDFLDSVFEFDGRIWRTLPPLLMRPGFLSTEYFEGRRVRYVSPVRLFVFLCVIAFFAAQLAFDVGGESGATKPVEGRYAAAETVEDVERLRDEALAGLAETRARTGTPPGVGAGLDAAERAIREQAERRIAELTGATPRAEPEPKPSFSFGAKPWHERDNPLTIGWLPEAGNAWLNRQIARAEGNIARVQADPNLLKDAVLGALPATFFVLLPLFAAMLKVAYLFKRRLYMEHLIVALHSHAFLCLALLLGIMLGAVSGTTPWLGWLSWLETALFVWAPVYLLLMQKRVYRQGWPMTILKYLAIGHVYLLMLSLGMIVVFLGSLAWL